MMNKAVGPVGRLLLATVWLLCAVSCKPDIKSGGGEGPGADAKSRTTHVYVLCEGLYGMNNTTLYRREVQTAHTVRDIFKETNRRGLGDTGNDIELYGGKIYVVLNGSNVIEVLDARTAVSLRQIPMTDERGVGRQPRYVCPADGKLYVCSFDGTVCRIDTASLEVEAVTGVGRNPDGICRSNGKLYVSNSGGLDFPDYDRTVSVIDLASFRETKRIEVGRNPYTIAADAAGYVYVSTRGDYDGFRQYSLVPDNSPEKEGCPPQTRVQDEKEGYNFYRIDPWGDTVDRVFDLPVLNFCINGDTAYLYNYDYRTKKCWIRTFDLRTERFLDDNFIADGTEIETPYAIAVDPYMEHIYVGEAYNYVTTGSVYCFSKQGRLQYTLHGVGQNPSGFAFLAEKE